MALIHWVTLNESFAFFAFLFSFSSENWEFLNYWFSNETWDKIRREGSQQQGFGHPLALHPPPQLQHICFYHFTSGLSARLSFNKGAKPTKSMGMMSGSPTALTFWFYSNIFSPGPIFTKIFSPSFTRSGEIVSVDVKNKDVNSILWKSNVKCVNIRIPLPEQTLRENGQR